MRAKKKGFSVFAILGIALILGLAFFGYLFLREPEAPSEEMANSSEISPVQSEYEDSPSEVSADAGVFQIDPTQSEARFTMNELLDGKPTVVVGVTSQISGGFDADFEQITDVQIGEILVNARDLTTDKSYRNRAIHNRILDSNTYEFISFVPTQVTPLSEEVNFGESVDFEISGALSIKGVTQDVIFTASITPVSATQIEGHAETLLAYADYGISIPSVQKVAEVDEEVLLEIDFVALAGTE